MNPLTRHHAASAVGLLAVALLTGASLGACGGGGDDGTADTTLDRNTSTTTAGDGGLPGADEGSVGTIDQGPFCTSIQSLQGLGAGGATTAAPEQVLAQNEAMLDLLDEAAASVPDGAPADVESLFDDYRAIAVAIGGAGGDVDAAYDNIQEHQPEVAARLFNATAHLPAFEYFANHCGITLQ
ncbi:MAG: hypothetical protein ACRDZU_13140 [Acidimicrobiales bacterium]